MAQSGNERWTVILRRADQKAAATVTAICLCLIAASWIYQAGIRGRLIEIDHAEHRNVEFRLDVNRAGWPELTTLPGISETLARRIVLSREETGPFRSVDDLQRVSGIGPKSIQRIRPLLLPVETAAAK